MSTLRAARIQGAHYLRLLGSCVRIRNLFSVAPNSRQHVLSAALLAIFFALSSSMSADAQFLIELGNSQPGSMPARDEFSMGCVRSARRAWAPNLEIDSKPAVVAFTVSRNGHISNIDLKQSSGSSHLDNDALAAVRKVRALSPIPAFYPDPIAIELTFRCAQHGHFPYYYPQPPLVSPFKAVAGELLVLGEDASQEKRDRWKVFLDAVVQKFYSTWKPPDVRWHGAVRFSIDQGGRVSEVKFAEDVVPSLGVLYEPVTKGGAGSLSVEQSVLDVLNSSATFPGCPPDLPANAYFNLSLSRVPVSKTPLRSTLRGRQAINRQASSDIDYGPYMAKLQRQVRSAWQQDDGPEERKRAVIAWRILRDGGISGLELLKGCGDPLLDKQVLDTVRRAAPFDSLPEGAPPNIDIQFTFDVSPDPRKQRLFRAELVCPHTRVLSREL